MGASPRIQVVDDDPIHTGSTEYTIPRSFSEIGIRTRDVLIKPFADMRTLRDAVDRLLKRGDKRNEGRVRDNHPSD